MSKISLEKILIDKVNHLFSKPFSSYKDIIIFFQNSSSEDKEQIQSLIKSIKICDPAVGSGHFLVSVLNRLLKIYWDFECIQHPYDKEANFKNHFQLTIEHDEAVIYNYRGELFSYKKPSNKHDLNHCLQEAIFKIKTYIISFNGTSTKTRIET